MNRRALLAVALAVAGLAAVLVGVRQELLHVAAGYGGTIDTGWGGPINHEERLLQQLGLVSLAGAVLAVRWRYAAALPAATGVVVLCYPVRAVAHHALETGLYEPVRTVGGETTVFVLGAEPFLLAAGGVALVLAGAVGWRAHTPASEPEPTAAGPETA